MRPQAAVKQPYEQAIGRILFHNAVLMGIASRFDSACKGNCNDNARKKKDIEAELDAAEADGDDDITLMAVMVNDPAARKVRELFAAALKREQQLIGQLRSQSTGWAGHNDNDRQFAKHDDRALRPPSLMTMNLCGLRGVAVPTAMLN